MKKIEEGDYGAKSTQQNKDINWWKSMRKEELSRE
jgi:hypothetical protein